MFTTTTFFQLCRYCTVAALGLILHLGLIALLVEIAGVHYTIAFLVVLPITFFSKFLLDRYWTFQIRSPKTAAKPFTYQVASKAVERREIRRIETRTRPRE